MESRYDPGTGDWVTAESRYQAVAGQPRFRELDSFVRSSPDLGWPLLLELLAEVPEDLVAFVGVGPLDAFINVHGSAFVDQIEAEARKNGRLREAAIEVILEEGSLPGDVEARLVAAFGDRFELLPRLDE